MGLLNYNAYFRMRSIYFLPLKCHIENDILQPRATLLKINVKRLLWNEKFAQLLGAVKVCYMQHRLQSTQDLVAFLKFESPSHI